MLCAFLLSEEYEKREKYRKAFDLLTKIVHFERKKPYFRHFFEEVVGRLRKLAYEQGKAVDGIQERLSAHHDGMYHQLVPHGIQQLPHFVADQVMRQRHEGAGPVVDDDVIMSIARNQLNEHIEFARIDLVPFHDLELCDIERLVAVKGPVHGIGVDAKRRLSF